MELQDSIQNKTRGGFLAMAGAAAFLSACGSSSDPQTADKKSSDAQAPTGGHDLEIVNYALTLEYIEVDFYDKVVEAGTFSGKTGDLFKLIQSHEHEHVDALEALAKRLSDGGKGGQVVERPQTRFPTGRGPNATLQLAATLENTGAAAYLGQVTLIQNREVLAAALSIHAIEGRHAAALNRLTGRPFDPDGALASPLGMSEVNDAVQRFII